MDILGLKYLTRNAVKYLRGTTREASVVGESVGIISKNLNPRGNTLCSYPITAKTRRNATFALYVHGASFAAFNAGVFICLQQNNKTAAFLNLLWSAIFGFLSVRAYNNRIAIDDELQRKRG